MEMLKGIGKRIRLARIERDLKQEDLANELNVSQNTISSWESGRTEIGTIALKRVALALGKPIEFFYIPIEKNDAGARRKAA